MLRLLVTLLLVVQVSSNTAWAQAEREYDPRGMTRTEIQMLQDALIWTSSYGALKDGGWGRMAADAARNWRHDNNLRQSETFNEAEFALLFRQALQARQAAGWTMTFEPNTGVWLGYPAAYARIGERTTAPSGVRMTEIGGPGSPVAITVMRVDLNLSEIRILMSGLASKSGVAKVNYRLDREQRQVLSSDMTDGATVYTRFDRNGGDWRGFTLRVQGGKVDVGRMIVAVSAEFSATGSPVIENPTDGPVLGPIMARVMAPPSNAPSRALPPAASSAIPMSLPPPDAVTIAPVASRLAGSGTAFVVRKDGLFMTNQHVVNGCTRMALADGTTLNVVVADRRRDLALLRAPGLTTPEVVRFRRDATVDLGEGVSLFGFPLYRAVSTSMNLTNGIVTSLAGLGDDPLHFQVNAAMQPGNSGGPLLDEGGLLIGVAVARINDKVVMREAGIVPQTMNYAIRGAVADSFLLENGILAEKGAGQGRADLREIARHMQEAVRPVLCYE